jgi:hypothetical protein
VGTGRRPPAARFEPQSFVDKKGKEKFRNISDSRIGNETLDKWGMRYYSARDFSDGLSPCTIVSCSDVTEGYHIAKLPGCLADLIWSWGITGMRMIYPGDPYYGFESDSDAVEGGGTNRPPRRPPEAPPRQEPVFGKRLFLGCSPTTCAGSCDKAHAGVDFDGHIMRWAVPHFGQSTAGSVLSVLNVLAICLLRFMALCNPTTGERRGASVRTGNRVV